MFFIHTLVEDIPEILGCMDDPMGLGEPIVLSSCINPLSVALCLAEESSLDVIEICESFVKLIEDIAGDPLEADIHDIDISNELMIKWLHEVTSHTLGIVYDDDAVYDMIMAKNNEAIHAMYFRNVEAIQLCLTPADAKGRTMSLAGDYRANTAQLVEKLYNQFGDFTMVCFPVDIGIGPTGGRIEQLICHVYNDLTASATRGMSMQGKLCPKCGEFYAVFPGQTEFCCGV